MAVQASQNNTSVPFIRSGTSYAKENETLLQDAGRSTVLASGTVMAKVAASQKWVPLTSITAVDGSAIAQGIFIGADVTAAALVAGDVTGQPILVGGGCTVDENQITVENSLTLETVFTANAVGTGVATPYYLVTVRDLLAQRGIFAKDTVDIDEYENA